MIYEYDRPYENIDSLNLYDVLDRNFEARRYFMSLPVDVKQNLEQTNDLIDSYDDLVYYADSYMDTH